MPTSDITRAITGRSRRGFLRAGAAGAAALSTAPLWAPQDAAAAGATDDITPYPIPWLDKNLHHNQVPTPDGPSTELAHIYHFAGQVGRALFTGQGQTNTGETLYIGVGTDYGYMRGAYLVGSGDTQHGLYSHN